MNEESKEKKREMMVAHFRRQMGSCRLIGNGFNYVDYNDLQDALDAGEDWLEVCYRLGDRAAGKAEEELKKGHGVTARSFFLNATAAYRVGQYTILHDNEQKLDMYKKLMDCFAQAAKLSNPPYEKVEIPYEDYTMPGYLMLPPGGDANCPAVVVLGGADGWREEFHQFSERLLERGLAALIVDGPGQGETRLFRKIYMPVEVEKPFTACVDWLYDDNRVGKNIGLVGHSFGGYLAPRTAYYAKNLKACVGFGGSYNPAELLSRNPAAIPIFSAVFGKDKEDTAELLKQVNLEGLAEKITCPLLMVHGDQDPLFPLDDVKRVYEKASGPKELKVYENDGHCCHNHDLEAICYIVDWLADTLKNG